MALSLIQSPTQTGIRNISWG